MSHSWERCSINFEYGVAWSKTGSLCYRSFFDSGNVDADACRWIEVRFVFDFPSDTRFLFADNFYQTNESLSLLSSELTGFPSALDTNAEAMCSVGLNVARHRDCPCNHRTISISSAVINLVGRRRNRWRVSTICMKMMIATWCWRWCGGKHSFRWDGSFLLTILWRKSVEVKSSGFTGAGREMSVTRWVKVVVWRVRTFDNCIRRSRRWIITTCTGRHRRRTSSANATKWTCTIANRSGPIISWNIFGFVAITNVSHATRANRLIINGINISSSTKCWWCPTFAYRESWRRVCWWYSWMNKFESLAQALHYLNHIVQHNHYWLRLKDHLSTTILVAFLNLAPEKKNKNKS